MMTTKQEVRCLLCFVAENTRNNFHFYFPLLSVVTFMFTFYICYSYQGCHRDQCDCSSQSPPELCCFYSNIVHNMLLSFFSIVVFPMSFCVFVDVLCLLSTDNIRSIQSMYKLCHSRPFSSQHACPSAPHPDAKDTL